MPVRFVTFVSPKGFSAGLAFNFLSYKSQMFDCVMKSGHLLHLDVILGPIANPIHAIRRTLAEAIVKLTGA